jgi:D-alanyl-D-alanine dipeptidase
MRCAADGNVEWQPRKILEELMKHAGFLIPAEEWDAFNAVAKANDLDRSQLLRRLVRQQIAEHAKAAA